MGQRTRRQERTSDAPEPPHAHRIPVNKEEVLTPQLAGEYGLRNKREIWRIQLTLSKVGRSLVSRSMQASQLTC